LPFSVLFVESFLVVSLYALTIFYIIWGIYHIVVAAAGHRPPPRVGKDERNKGSGSLPKISVIIPARNEPILSRTIEACLNHTDYPLEKKEIVVVVDDPEGERIAFWYQQQYPKNVKLLARRRLYPTKPSALNDSIHLCTGDIIAIMDVEDIPDRDVFLKAAAALANEDIFAVQAILRISNPQDSWITRIFSMEYAGWFRLLLNGRSRLGLYAPLGGTGNYFKKGALKHVGLYDATNLAEDAELSIRLLMAGWNVSVLDARHWEEAPMTFKGWIRQRTRWYRGWLQSLWKYIPVMPTRKNLQRVGILGTFSTLMMLVAPLVVLLNWLAYGITLVWLLELAGLLSPMLLANAPNPYWMAIPSSFNVLYFYFLVKGSKLEGIETQFWHDLPRVVFYLNFMMPAAALRALYQEIFKPVAWEKTTHNGRGIKWHQTLNQ
jgi:cellulose synthase/poly-beta-1,6-N-acetylglucosamine synthase-like glycosyltransferase